MAYTAAFRYEDREYYAVLDGEVSFGGGKSDSVQVPGAAERLLVLRRQGGGVRASARPPLSVPAGELPLNEIISLGGRPGTVLYVSRIAGQDAQPLELPYSGRITCGRRSTNDLVLSYPIVSGQHFQLLCEDGTVHVEDLDSTNHLYLNGRRIEKAAMRSGDVLSIYTFRFCLKNGVLSFENMGSGLKLSDSLKARASSKAVPASGSPGKDAPRSLRYHLSPRTREQLPQAPIVLSSAPGAAHSPGGRRGYAAYLLSSGAMLAASLATGMMSPAMLLARAAGMISPIANMAMYSKMTKEEKQQLEEYERMRQERYRAYIDDQKARIRKVADVQRRILSQENPPPEECMRTVQKLRRSLWERLPEDSDFLNVRLGIGQVPLCVEVKTRADAEGFKLTEDDELEQLSARIIEETRYVDQAPVCVSLARFQTVGLVGPKENVEYLLRSILVELSTQHSYLDVHVIGLFEESARGRWGVLRWLPHIWDETGQTRYIAFDPQRRHTVCETLGELIQRRKAAARSDTGQRARPARPHFVLVAQSRALLYAEGIYEDLVSNDPALGFTTLVLSESLYELPQTCQVIADCSAAGRYCAYQREKYDQRAYFTPDEPVHQAQLEQFFRRQAAIELETRAGAASIPSTVTFLEGYQAETVEDLGILKRWEDSKPYLTLAAPLGIMEGGRVFSLDVRSGEQSHGPHGLLAGTTGSGKSELLQSWILSMAVNYHPHDVNFVIIDYKGGGMSDLMEPLPHVVGKITNIDRNISRALVSLKSELRRRQELFAQCGVNNIDKYQRAYDEGLVRERLPHLIIVTDEFAEMKKEEPEFMTELNSVATIGRSLGVHMLLATQKPAGVVTDQINSNARFRICMKVQDVADSREMIKRADAARITQAGRAYVRVGEDELFELFQSFYSAGEYTEKKAGGPRGENQVRIVGVTGNRIGVDKKRQKRKSTEIVDELTAVTAHINALCRENGIEKLPGPWLPELPAWLPLDELGAPAFDGTAWTPRKGLSVPIGRYDVPAMQRQGVQMLDFLAVGHYGVYGSPGSGKTTLLKTALTALGLFYPPRKLSVTVIDAGNWSMSEFAGMPHVREVILNQEAEKLARFVLRMRKELEVRRTAFLKHAVSSLETYWETVSEDLPAIVVAVDHIAPLFEQYVELGNLFTEIATVGAAFGVFLLFSANSTIGINYKFLQLVKGCFALQMPDKGDYSTLVGPIAGISLPNRPGRALAKGNPAVAFHTAVYLDEQDEQRRHERLEQLFADMAAAGKGLGSEAAPEPQPSSRTPQQEAPEEREAGPAAGGDSQPAGRGALRLGRDAQTLEPVTADLLERYVLLAGAKDSGLREAFLGRAAHQLAEREAHQVLTLEAGTLKETRATLEQALNDRRKSRLQHKKEPDFDQAKWLEGFTQLCLVIPDLPEAAAAMEEDDRKSFRRIVTKSGGLGLTVLAGADREVFSAPEPDLLTDAVLSAGQVLALDGRPREYAPKQELDHPDADLPLDGGEAVWLNGGELKVVRL